MARVEALAKRLIAAIRDQSSRFGALEDFLREYSLSTEEGLALMVLAEALLRVPDDATADRLIEDKLNHAPWARHAAVSDALLVSASAWALGTTARILQKGETAQGIVASLARRIGMSALRPAARQAIQILGGHFVLGRDIAEALAHSQSRDGKLYRYSFDMLGEGARTSADAAHYYDAYAKAIEAIGHGADKAAQLPDRPGISVKLSALHPRFEPLSRARVMDELVPRLSALAHQAKRHNLNFTIDAEEADRLELSLDVLEAVLADPALAGWNGFGLAVQAYQKRAGAVLEHVFDLARRYDRQLMVRLVKGAYWDTEIKRAQERGLSDYPVFTAKAMTDLNYLACARQMLAARPRIFPQFATHNALTVASIIEYAGGVSGYEFQRLHGMGEALFKALRRDYPEAGLRIYAPVGGYRDLLAYLVRRLLENGANSSFVAQVGDPNIALDVLVQHPQIIVAEATHTHADLPLPEDIHGASRKGARGIEFGARQEVDALLDAIAHVRTPEPAMPLINGQIYEGKTRSVQSPIDGSIIGQVSEATPDLVEKAMAVSQSAFRSWSASPVANRALCLERMADALETERPKFLALLRLEAGKTLDDAVAEHREAVDLCRYYAAEARHLFAQPEEMPGPTGETNQFSHFGRGIFVCISPWNFPLAIFLGQIAAALATGNAVVAKPAEQTPLIAAEAIRLLHRCGVPGAVSQVLPGDGEIGAALVASPHIAGVIFTGSMETARTINRTLASKDGPIIPFIAETGGINAMIVDATALPEQVTDDVIASAFRSAGQRCSALRLLCVQDDVADTIFAMIAGAAAELRVGDPRDLATQVGPVIDAEARAALDAHIAAMKGTARAHYAGTVPTNAAADGFYVAPHMFEIASLSDLNREIFGPVLHVLRYKAAELDALLDGIAAKGYGLTLGIHSRIDATIEHIIARRLAGNIYVNRNMIGAVVGTQPFGGFGLSGTGPKAGGPNYLKRFTLEECVSINTAAVGGNAGLLTGR